MKTLILLLLMTQVCLAEQSGTIELSNFNNFSVGKSITTQAVYYISKGHYLQEFIKEYPVTFKMVDARNNSNKVVCQATYKTPWGIPKHDVYCGQGMWLIKYEQNEGNF